MFKQSAQHVASYYAQTYPTNIPLRPTLQGTQDADVLIIGAGFSGLHTALRLTQAGKRVTLLEASRVAWAASGRNGGQALLGWSCDMPPLEQALGIERTQRLWASMCWAAEEMRELPQRHGFDIDYRQGSLWTAVLPRRVKMLEEALHDAEHKWGYDALRLIGRDELPQWIDSPRYQAALYDAKGAHLNPLKLAQGLASTIEAVYGQIYEQSQVLSYQQARDGYVARTDRGEVRCQVLVLACNAYIDRLDRGLSRRLLPVGSYQVATAPLDADFAHSLLPRNSCVIDNQFVPDYFRLTPDHRLLFGGGCTTWAASPRTSPAPPARTWSGCSLNWPGWPSTMPGAATSIAASSAPRTSAARASATGCRVSPAMAFCRPWRRRVRSAMPFSAMKTCWRCTKASTTAASPAATCWLRLWKLRQRPGTACATVSEGHQCCLCGPLRG